RAFRFSADNRNFNRDHRANALITSGYGQQSSQFAGAFTHTAKAHTDSFVALQKRAKALRGYTAAIVHYSECNRMRPDLHADSRPFGFRMTMNVGEAFLQNPEHGGLDFIRETGNGFRNVQRNVDAAALREPFHIPANRRGQTGFIEQGRMEQI